MLLAHIAINTPIAANHPALAMIKAIPTNPNTAHAAVSFLFSFIGISPY